MRIFNNWSNLWLTKSPTFAKKGVNFYFSGIFKVKSNNTLSQDEESIWNRIEIEQEPIFKRDPENTINMVTMSASENATSVSISNLIDGDTYDFTDVRELNEAKS